MALVTGSFLTLVSSSSSPSPSRSGLLKSKHDEFMSSLLLPRSPCPCPPTSVTVCRRRRRSVEVAASLSPSTTKHSVLQHFHQKSALKIISGLQNFDRDNVASVVIAADKNILLQQFSRF